MLLPVCIPGWLIGDRSWLRRQFNSLPLVQHASPARSFFFSYLSVGGSMSIFAKYLAANRANARKSASPRTKIGKLISRNNAAMAVDIHKHRPRLANVTGGLSGPAIKPIALHLVSRVYR